jgi:hypothetical protein
LFSLLAPPSSQSVEKTPELVFDEVLANIVSKRAFEIPKLRFTLCDVKGDPTDDEKTFKTTEDMDANHQSSKTADDDAFHRISSGVAVGCTCGSLRVE